MHASAPHASFNSQLRQQPALLGLQNLQSKNLCQKGRDRARCMRERTFRLGLLRADLRQTPGELQGKPFQWGPQGLGVPCDPCMLQSSGFRRMRGCRSYVMLSAAVEAPCPSFVTRRLRLLRAWGQVSFAQQLLCLVDSKKMSTTSAGAFLLSSCAYLGSSLPKCSSRCEALFAGGTCIPRHISVSNCEPAD